MIASTMSRRSASWIGGVALVLGCGVEMHASRGRSPNVAGGVLSSVVLAGAPLERPMVATHEDWTCVLRTDRTVWCWGANRAQRLGPMDTRASMVLRPTRVRVPPALQITALEWGYCVLLADHTVRCFGRPTAQGEALANIPEVDQIASAEETICVRTHGGEVWCQGREFGAQGWPIRDDLRTEPRRVLSGASSIAVGSGHACAVMHDGRVRCWGSNRSGQLGVPPDDERHPVPVEVDGLRDVRQVAAGFLQTCAVTRDGALWCWGRNSAADAPPDDNHAPRRTFGVTDATEVFLGTRKNCVLRRGGVLGCWIGGVNGAHRQTSELRRSNSDRPVLHLGMRRDQVCTVIDDHEVRCGGCTTGACGEVPVREASALHDVRGLSDTIDLSAQGALTCAVRRDGTVWCWGWSPLLALEESIHYEAWRSRVPVQIPGMRDLQTVSVGGDTLCGVRLNGTVLCTRSSRSGGVRLAPAEVPGLHGVQQVVNAGDVACARRSDDSVWCWGRGEPLGQTLSTSCDGAECLTPTRIQSFDPARISSISSGLDCIVTSDHRAICVGDMGFRLLESRSDSSATRAGISAMRGVLELSTTPSSGCGRLADGASWCWGVPGDGLFADEPVPDCDIGRMCFSPPRRAELDVVTQIALDFGGGCALHAYGTVSCWGGHRLWRTEFSETPERDWIGAPGRIPGLSDAVQIAVADRRGCARRRNGSVVCWGSEDGRSVTENLPAQDAARVAVRW